MLASWDGLRGGGAFGRASTIFCTRQAEIAKEAVAAAIETLGECATLAAETGDLEIGVPVAAIWPRLMPRPGSSRPRCSGTANSMPAMSAEQRNLADPVPRGGHQYETQQLQARVETERSRADGLEQMNLVLAQEAALLMNVSMEDALTGFAEPPRPGACLAGSRDQGRA